MRKTQFTLAAGLALLFAIGAHAGGPAHTQVTAGRTSKLKIGDAAPDFTLLAWDGTGPPRPVALRDFRGKKNVALAFFVFAFTGG